MCKEQWRNSDIPRLSIVALIVKILVFRTLGALGKSVGT